MTESYDTVIRAFGNNAGIEVPPEVLTALDAGKRPRVKVGIGDYNFSTTVGAMGGLALIPLAKAHREASGLQAGQAIRVVLELDTAPLAIDLPSELTSALASAGLTEVFGKLSPSRRKEFARQVVEAKTEETRARRIAKVIAQLS